MLDKAFSCLHAPQAASIYDVAVHPDFRRCGVGKKLVRVLVQNLYNKVWKISWITFPLCHSPYSMCWGSGWEAAADAALGIGVCSKALDLRDAHPAFAHSATIHGTATCRRSMTSAQSCPRS